MFLSRTKTRNLSTIKILRKLRLTVLTEFDAIVEIFHSTVPLVHGQGRPVCRSPTAFFPFSTVRQTSRFPKLKSSKLRLGLGLVHQTGQGRQNFLQRKKEYSKFLLFTLGQSHILQPIEMPLYRPIKFVSMSHSQSSN